MTDLGHLSADERRMVEASRITDTDRVGMLGARNQVYLEIGVARMNGYGYILKELDGTEYRVGIYDWKRDECPEASFDDLRAALDYLLAHAAFAS